MKKIILILITALFPILGIGQIKSASLQASGLTCSMCSNSIYKSLKTISFIEEIDSDVETSTFNIKFKTNQEVDLDALQKAVEKAGFSVANLKFVINVNNIKVQNQQKSEIGNKTFHFVNIKDKVLNGDVEFRIVDKDFVLPKEFKKLKNKLEPSDDKRIYNVTI